MATRIDLKLPDFYTDEMFSKSQEDLYGLGSGILQGDLPDFYSSLGKTGSTEFQNMLALINRNTAQAVAENNVRRNISRSGVGASSVAKAVADATTTLSWQDYLKASQEKAALLGTGINTVTGVRDAGLSFGGQKNQFGLNAAQLQLDADKFNATMEAKEAEIAAAKKAQKNALWSSILSSAIGAVGNIYGVGQISKALGSAENTKAWHNYSQTPDFYNMRLIGSLN